MAPPGLEPDGAMDICSCLRCCPRRCKYRKLLELRGLTTSPILTTLKEDVDSHSSFSLFFQTDKIGLNLSYTELDECDCIGTDEKELRYETVDHISRKQEDDHKLNFSLSAHWFGYHVSSFSK
ncbi:hypothetical protein CDAR_70511 [Caerostris darwini]|uniref:Uncharacterized protein n=1 Tax=Caerostris darwini TaxID=1538125 RepID=A0AAV4WGC3_9ARAC|nr:hypothetical protein CDAR_70511 [Caerostris darwini]